MNPQRTVRFDIQRLDRQLASCHRDLCGCRNKYVKDRIYREIANLRERKAAVVAGIGDPGRKEAV